MDIIALTNPAENRPGIGSQVLIAELAWITAYGAAATNTNFGDLMRITGDHVFDTGLGFVPWETEDDIARLKIPVTGSRSSLGLKPSLEIFLPGLYPAQMLTAIQNKSFMALVSAFGCGAGQYLQIGDQCNPLRIMPSDGFDSGVAGGNDPRGFKLTLGSNYSVAFYEGDVTMYGA